MAPLGETLTTQMLNSRSSNWSSGAAAARSRTRR